MCLNFINAHALLVVMYADELMLWIREMRLSLQGLIIIHVRCAYTQPDVPAIWQ